MYIYVTCNICVLIKSSNSPVDPVSSTKNKHKKKLQDLLFNLKVLRVYVDIIRYINF